MALAGGAVRAQGAGASAPQPANVVALSAGANLELTMDWLTVVFGATREGTDAQAVQTQLRQALDAALAEARKAVKPGGDVQVRTGGYSLNPRYTPRPSGGGNLISGWIGQAELIVEGRDSSVIAALLGKVPTMAVQRVSWSLSRELREKVEGEVTAAAIKRFRERAEGVARQFGMSGWSVREVSVSSNEPAPPQPMMRVQAMRAGVAVAEESLPVEAGKALVTVTVAGTVQMK
jgi:predicted secreted protein